MGNAMHSPGVVPARVSVERRFASTIPRRAAYGLCALLMPLALGLGGCVEKEFGPCFGLLLAGPLEIRIVSEYSAAAGYEFELGRNPAPTRCTTSLRPTPGTSLEVQVVEQLDEDHQSCDSNTVEVKGGSGLELGARTDSLALGTGDISEILNATHVLTSEGCRGSWGFSIESRGSQGRERPGLRTRAQQRLPAHHHASRLRS